DAEDRPGRLHLRGADLGDALPDLRPVQLRVQHAAALPAGAGDDEDRYALGYVLRHGRGTLARLVVGVCVDGHQAQLLSQGGLPVEVFPGHRSIPATCPVRSLSWSRDGLLVGWAL